MTRTAAAPARFSRRRALAVLAAAGATLLTGRPAKAAPARWEWRGQAMGADARLILLHPDQSVARAAADACAAEIARLEAEFSLYRADSALSRLNRFGRLDHPGHDLRRLLAEALGFAHSTDGTFDPTVQPLWELYAEHFARTSGAIPSPEAVAAVMAAVGWRRVAFSVEAIALAPGTRLTLNGIAQGYITDRVADLLRARGFERVLIDLGETRALGAGPRNAPWAVGIAERSGGSALFRIPLEDRALAVSAPAGTVFEPSGRWHHLLDTATGAPASSWRLVAVRAADATTADALSTALAASPPERSRTILGAHPGAEAWAMDGNTTLRRIAG
ncbi:MAG: FAD:protein FMN transferase [Rhodospirillales bacterium]|nr:FAD:protein FMN transferase [Rhodospirillales bacterium]